MPNVLTIAPYPFLPPKLGGQKNIAFFYAFFAPLVKLTCVTTKNNESENVGGYELLKILSRSRSRYFNLFYFFTLRNIIRQKKISHLLIEHPYYGWLGVLLKSFCGVKLIVRSQNIESIRFKSIGKWWWKILWYYERFTHRKAHLNFFIQEDDLNYGIQQFGLSAEKCFVITYGFEMTHAPTREERNFARERIGETYGIQPDEKILLFNGALNYKPNLDAVDSLLEKINPLLDSRKDYKYRIIICGSRLPAEYQGLVNYQKKHIIYAGFVDDISLFYKGADIFINPVIEGGGIKTKVVEALGHDLSVVSTGSGAVGIPVGITGGKMKVVKDQDWISFTEEITSMDTSTAIPAAYFDHFYWGNIAARAAELINHL